MAAYKHGEKVDDFVSSDPVFRTDSNEDGEVIENNDHLHRRLGNRQIQLMAIGGTIGTALFVSIGGGLYKGGPGSLFLAYSIYACFLGLVNNCIAEMTTAYPVSGGFIRLAGHFVDDAFGFMAGYNCEHLIMSRLVESLLTVASSLHLRGSPHPLRDHRSVYCAQFLER
jgi:amino acid transporter